jgi:hypothetical protein
VPSGRPLIRSRVEPLPNGGGCEENAHPSNAFGRAGSLGARERKPFQSALESARARRCEPSGGVPPR